MRLPTLAICLIAVATLTVAAILSGGAPGEATNASACSTATPSNANSLLLCNTTVQTADGVLFYVGGPMFVQPSVTVNPAGCQTPTATAFESAPDFTQKITVTWPNACVAPGSAVELAFECSNGDTPAPCQLQTDCVSWTLGGQPLGSPCPTPSCGGVPCCNGLPCPTPTRSPYPGVPVAAGTPGDYDCDEMITLADAGRLLAQLAGVPWLPLGRPCSIATGVTPHDLGDPTCDNMVDTRDVLAILLIVVELRDPGYC